MRLIGLVAMSLAATFLVALAVSAPPDLTAAQSGKADDKAGWTPLFNGKDLEGWKATGDATFKVEDGLLVGMPADAKGGDLYTEKEWGDFELRFTYKVVWPANSGVWYRTQYQFDILKWKNPVTFSGALYYPGCKGLFLWKNLDESIENRDGWNEGQVYAGGDRLIHWLNGRKIGEGNDKTFAKGKVGIQVHGGAEFKDMKVFYKTIEIRPLKAGEGPTAPAPPRKDAR